MKRIMEVLLAVSILTSLGVATYTPTRLPGGLSIATETQEAATGPTMAAGSLYVVGNTKMSGTLSTVGLQTATGGITIPSGAVFTIASGATLTTGTTYIFTVTAAEGIQNTYGLSSATATITDKLTVSGANGIANTYGITTGSVTATSFIKAVGLTNTGGNKMAYQIATDSVTLTATSAGIVFSTGAATVQLSVTLPTAVGNGGLTYTVKKVSLAAGKTTIIPATGETIDNATGNNVEIDAVKDYLTITSDGFNWQVVGRYIQ